MNHKLVELAKAAGFVLWKNEKWNPGDIIDWSSSYDNELEIFANMIIDECINVSRSVKNNTDSSEKIREHFRSK